MKLLPKQKLLSGIALAVAVLNFAAPGVASAQSLADDGFEIAARSDRSDRGFNDSTVDLKMVLRNRAGAEATRTLTLQTLEMPDENVGDKSLVIFHSPGDIDGTALLSHAKILDPDDQWLLLPALKRVKRISSVNKSGPFVGSEFAFEDFTGLELNKFDYAFVETVTCGDMVCDVIERLPQYEYSGYSKQVAWIDQDVFQVRKIDFYDRRGDLLKTLTFDDYRLYAGQFWRAHDLKMVNHQTGKSTDLIYDSYSFNINIGDRAFTKGALARAR